MEKRNNTYHLHLKEISVKDGTQGNRTLSFDFSNHDDLFQIFERIKAKQLFDEEQAAHEFALGLKLFTEVMITHKDHSLFEEVRPAIGQFMKKLKNL